jgi:SpoVK/Ycf46/Vps4 family AAA+-type ATPase
VDKPLYPLTCGDLGSVADDVEMNLKKHFTLASRWDCVMLLDEADVFLAKRKLEDLQRNSIVSVFLRMLEYYKGLLFLTTNRVGTFDEAFTSRVHISLFCEFEVV